MALEVGSSWARVDCLKSLRLSSQEVLDVQSVTVLLDEALAHVKDVDRLRAKLGVSRGGLQEAEGIVSELDAKLTSYLSKISALLASA